MKQDRKNVNHASDISFGAQNDLFVRHDRAMKAFRRSHAYPVEASSKAAGYPMEYDGTPVVALPHIRRIPEYKLSQN